MRTKLNPLLDGMQFFRLGEVLFSQWHLRLCSRSLRSEELPRKIHNHIYTTTWPVIFALDSPVVLDWRQMQSSLGCFLLHSFTFTIPLEIRNVAPFSTPPSAQSAANAILAAYF